MLRTRLSGARRRQVIDTGAGVIQSGNGVTMPHTERSQQRRFGKFGRHLKLNPHWLANMGCLCSKFTA